MSARFYTRSSNRASFPITVKPEPQKGRTDQQIRDGIGPDRNADKNDRPKRQTQEFSDLIEHQNIEYRKCHRLHLMLSRRKSDLLHCAPIEVIKSEHTKTKLQQRSQRNVDFEIRHDRQN